MELVLPRNYVEIEEAEMMYLDGGKYGVNYISFSWNYARIFLDAGATKCLTGVTIGAILGFLGASAGPFAGAVLGSVGYLANDIASNIRNGIWFDVNYYQFGKVTKFGFQ